LGPNPNFFSFYMAQIWHQNFGPNQEKWTKVFLDPNYNTWAAQLTLLNLRHYMKSIYTIEKPFKPHKNGLS
jgi:hypothetical protein